ncbi:MAG: DUF4065 domain-containing protein [Eubacterium sp.]|nr:DUF4065 domain-containing protein [Eubacterium sp.]
MNAKERKEFCIECRKDTGYVLQKKKIHRTIKGKEYIFNITTAICSECGEEMSLPGLIDRNMHEIDEQYRAAEGIVDIDDIQNLMEIYKLGKAPVSLALGFGEVTISRYLAGQIPSKEYSDVIKAALSSPGYMKKKMRENREKIAETAYKKAMVAATQMENLFAVSEKMLRVIAYLFENLEEVTPLMLQKLLYFIQGVSYAVNGKPMFEEDCQAWVHGPVFPEVYDLFRDFKYNPIEDARFALFERTAGRLSDDEKKVIDLVIGSFGLYGGKVLERITHNEKPWIDARKGYSDGIPSNELLSKESIRSYYQSVNKEYGISNVEGLKRYIQSTLKGIL